MIARRRVLGLIGVAGIGLSQQRRPPNVLLLIADDLNTWTGLQQPGDSASLTPNLNRWARTRAVVFRNAWCASPLCNPSRTATLTGRAPWNTGIYDNSHWWKPTMPDAMTMPRFFRRNGYYAAGAGKVFHHTAGFNPPDQWDEFHPFAFDDPWDRPAATYPEVPRTAVPDYIPMNGMKPTKHEFDWGSLPKPESEYGDARTVAWAQQFLSRRDPAAGKPFFLAAGLFRPHLPWYVPPEHFAAIKADAFKQPTHSGDLNDVPQAGKEMAAPGRSDFLRTRDAGKWNEAVRAYRASVHYADALYGRLLETLYNSPHANNTIVVFWSDNGFHLGEKERFHKSTLWERASHVPLAFAAPGVEPGTVDAPASLLDIFPTLTALCELKPPAGLDGEDRSTQLRTPSASGKPVVTNFQPGNYAVTDGHWRYLRYHDGSEELYDLVGDPNEWTNLAAKPAHRERIPRMAQHLPKQEAPPVPGKSAYTFDPATYTWIRKAPR